MSLKIFIVIISIIVYTAVNSYFIRTDEEFKKQTYDRKVLGDPFGIQRFRQQPKKMSILTAILVGPTVLYYIYLSFSAG